MPESKSQFHLEPAHQVWRGEGANKAGESRGEEEEIVSLSAKVLQGGDAQRLSWGTGACQAEGPKRSNNGGCQSSEGFQEAVGPALGSVLSALLQRVCLKCVHAVCASSQGHVLRSDTGPALTDLVFWDPPQAAALSLGGRRKPSVSWILRLTFLLVEGTPDGGSTHTAATTVLPVWINPQRPQILGNQPCPSPCGGPR